MKKSLCLIMLSSLFVGSSALARHDAPERVLPPSPMLFDREVFDAPNFPNFDIKSASFEPLDHSLLKTFKKERTPDGMDITTFDHELKVSAPESTTPKIFNRTYKLYEEIVGDNKMVEVELLSGAQQRDLYLLWYDKAKKLKSLVSKTDSTGKSFKTNGAVLIDAPLCTLVSDQQQRTLPKECFDFLSKFNDRYGKSLDEYQSHWFGHFMAPDMLQVVRNWKNQSFIDNLELVVEVKRLCDRYGSFLAPEEKAPVVPEASKKAEAKIK